MKKEIIYVLFGASLCFPSYLAGLLNSNETESRKPFSIELKDTNKDGLVDLIYSTGEVYLQTKEGKFIPYKDTLTKR